MERYIVDRIEDGIITLEKDDMSHFYIKESDLSFKVSEGNVIFNNSGIYTIDKNEEALRRKNIFDKQKNIFKNK